MCGLINDEVLIDLHLKKSQTSSCQQDQSVAGPPDNRVVLIPEDL